MLFLYLQKEGGTSETERALFGCLTGKLSAVLPRCRTYEDRLWAYVSASLEYHLSVALQGVAAAKKQRFVTSDALLD